MDFDVLLMQILFGIAHGEICSISQYYVVFKGFHFLISS